MLFAAVFAVVLALSTGQTKFCCTPDQWEGHAGELTGYLSQGIPHLTQASLNISYDFKNKKLATSTLGMADQQPINVTVILDYAQKFMFTISNGICTPSVLKTQMSKACVPDNARPEGIYTYGFGKNSLKAQGFLAPFDKASNVSISMTVGNPCIPIGQVIYGSPNTVPAVQSMGFYNVTPGIKDPDVFTPPKSCLGRKLRISQPHLPNLMEHLLAIFAKPIAK